MKDRVEEIFEQVMAEDNPDPLRRFAELVRDDERGVCCSYLMKLHQQYGKYHNYYHVAAVNLWERKE